jgi:threonine/homoserine/homoserine lactone efflux protein
VAACVLLNLTPGADTLYILTRSVAHGRRAGLWSAAGIMTGCLVHTAAASLGLSVVLATSSLAFGAVKVAGAAYLIWLGVTALLGRHAALAFDAEPRRVPARTLFVQGLATNVLNPKVALFFLAFLPQFVDPAGGGPLAFGLLGLTFVATGSLWCLVLVLASSTLSSALRRRPRVAGWMNRGSGVVFVGLGAAVLAGERP